MSAPKLYASLQIVATDERAALNLANGFGAWLDSHEISRVPVSADWSDDNGSASVRISMSAPDQTELERVKAEREEWKKCAGELAEALELITTCEDLGCVTEVAASSTLTRYNQMKGQP